MYSSSGDTEIGATLRKARLDSGITLEDVEYETKIRKRYLDALEREDYDDLPSAVYARGFLKTYANYLGLDGEELSQQLKNRRDAVQEPQGREVTPEEESFGRRSSTRGTRAFTGGVASRRARTSPVALLGFALALVLLASAVSGLYWVGQSSRTTQEVPERQSEPSGDNGRPAETGGTTENDPSVDQGSQDGTASPPTDGAKAEQTEPAETPPPPPEVMRITVTVEQVPAWLNVQADGNVIYEQLAQPGFSQTFEAGQQITVWTGNAGAVRLEVNGQDYGALGAPGEVKRQIFTLKPAEG